MAKKTGAQYIQSPTGQKKSSQRRFGSWLAGFAAVLAIMGSVVTGGLAAATNETTNQPVASVASAFDACGVIGWEMDAKKSWTSNWAVPLPDVSNRRFTLPEVVPNSIWWSNFSGTGDATEFLTGTYDKAAEGVNADRSGASVLPMSKNLPAPLKEPRNLGNCTFTTAVTVIGSMGLNLANVVTGFTSWIATAAFNASFICDAEIPAGTTPEGCVDLVQVIGGRTNDVNQGGTGVGGGSGILGNLTSGIYKPLVVLVVLVTAMLIFWTGIVKRQFRQALGQLVWLVLSFIIGLAILLNPSMLVKAPMVATNTVLGCVIGAFNGAGCTGGGNPDTGDTTGTAKDNICVSNSVSATTQEQTALYVNSMGCSIWSAFVLEPYARGAFGVGVSNLDLDSTIDGSTGQTVRELVTGPGWTQGTSTSSAEGTEASTAGSASNICVNLQSSSSYNGMKGGVFSGGTGTSGNGVVCNLAVWDLFMKTQANGGAITTATTAPDGTWFNVMSRLPANAALWENYTNKGGAFNKWGMGGIAAIVSIVGSALIIFTSITALVYYVIAVLMLAFAPIFFLIGLHAGRGKRIMLGWLEQIFSNILKYLVSAIFVLVAITFYGAILGTASDLFVTILFIILITAALIMYRKELIGILGRVEMGGEKMTDMADSAMSRVSGTASNVGRFGKRMGTAAVAGAAAGAITGQGMGQGFSTAAWRELKQGNNVVARTMQAAQSISTDMKQDKAVEQREMATRASQLESDATKAEMHARNQAEAAKPVAEALAESNSDLKQKTETESDIKEKLADRSMIITLGSDKSLQTTWGRANPEAANDYKAIRAADVKADDNKLRAAEQRAAGNEPAALEFERHAEAATQKSVELRSQFEVKYDGINHSGTEVLKEASANQIIGENAVIRKTEDPELKARYEAATSKEASFTANEAIYKEAVQARVEAKGQLDTLQQEWDKAAADLQTSVQNAAVYRNDADTAQAQSDSMKATIKDFGPGDVLTTRKLKTADDTAAFAGAKASKTASVSDQLQAQIADLESIAKTTRPTLNADVIVKGEFVSGLEAGNTAGIAREQKKEDRAQIAAEAARLASERSNAGAVAQTIAGAVGGAVMGAPSQFAVNQETRIIERETEKIVTLETQFKDANRVSDVAEMGRLRTEIDAAKRNLSEHQQKLEQAQSRNTEAARRADAMRERGESTIVGARENREQVTLAVPTTYATDERISEHQKAVINKAVEDAQKVASRNAKDPETQAILKQIETRLNNDAKNVMTDAELKIIQGLVKKADMASRSASIVDSLEVKVTGAVEDGAVKLTQRLLPKRPGAPVQKPQEPTDPPAPERR